LREKNKREKERVGRGERREDGLGRAVGLGWFVFFLFFLFFSFFFNTQQPKIKPTKIKATHIHLFYLIYENKQLIFLF
jgi:hypothetical protein